VPKERLDSWKNIAEYLERSLRTVQRWHAYHGLPVRHFGGSKGSVFAYTDEIDRWLITLSEEARTTPLGEDGALELRKRRSLEFAASAGQMWEARSECNLQIISGLYRKAIDEDIGNFAAFIGLANTMIFGTLQGVLEGSVAYPRAQEALKRVPPSEVANPDARCAAAWLSMVYERNWRQARAGFEEVLDKQPWSSFALSGRSLLHVVEGNLEEASACAWEAWKRNPMACSLGALMCWIAYLAGDVEQALDLVGQVRGIGGCGSIIAATEACALMQQGSIVARFRRLEAICGEFPEDQTLQGLLGFAYAKAGKPGKAEEILRDMERMSELKKRSNGYGLALVLLALDRKQDAAKWLEVAYEEGALWSLGFCFDPMLAPLRDEPRFEMILRKTAATAEDGFPSLPPRLSPDASVDSVFGTV